MRDATVWNILKTAFIVTLFTVMVWLYAEGRNLTEQEVTVSIRLVEQSPDVALIQERGEVRLKFLCATGQVERVRDVLLTGALRLPVDLTPTPDGQPQAVTLERRIESLPELNDLGVQIVSITPEVIEVRVEPMIDIDVPIEIDAGDVEFSQVTLTPETLELRLPQGSADRVRGETITADLLNAVELADLPSNVPHTRRDVPLIIPADLRGPRISFERDTVDIVFTLRDREQTFTLTGVPIHVNALWSELNRYDLQIEGGNLVLDRDIVLRGPGDTIERIKQNQLRIAAELRLRIDDFVPGPASKIASFTLPPGVALVGPPPSIRYTLTERP